MQPKVRWHWRSELDGHIACILEKSGHPKRVSVRQYPYFVELISSRTEGPLSPAVLAILQAKARLFMQLSLRSSVKNKDVAISLHFSDSEQDLSTRFGIIRLDNEKFPCNTAHFRKEVRRRMF